MSQVKELRAAGFAIDLDSEKPGVHVEENEWSWLIQVLAHEVGHVFAGQGILSEKSLLSPEEIRTQTVSLSPTEVQFWQRVMFDHPDANSRWKLSHRWHYHPVKRKDEDFSRLTELFEKALHAIFQADFSCQLTEVEKKIEVLFYQPEDLQLFIKQWLKNGGISLICELDELRRTVPKELTSHKEARLLELPAMMIQVVVWNVVLNTFAKYQIGEYQGVTRFFAKEKRKKYLREREEITLQYGGHPIYDRVAALVAHFFDLPAGEKRQNFYREKYVKERWEKCLRVIQAASHMRVNAG